MHIRLATLCVLALATTLVTLRAPGGVSAQSAGFHPSTMTIENALRGQRYEISTSLINQSDESQEFRLSSTGDSEAWITFAEPGAPLALLTEITVPAKSEVELLVAVEVPKAAANGTYDGMNHFDGEPAGEDGHGSVLLSFQQPVSIAVTGDQVVDLRSNGVSALSVEVGQPLRIEVPLTNAGNVDAEPRFEALVYPDTATGRADPAATIEQALETIRAGQSGTPVAEWPTSGMEPGTYWASYTVSLDSDSIEQGEFSFELLAVGSAVRSGIIQSLTVVEPLQPGTIGRADAVFENQGQVDAVARFEGQLMKDGVAVATAESPGDLRVGPGEQATLSAYFPLADDAEGTFELRGRVYFEGAQSDEAMARFSLAGDGGLDMGMLAAGGILALAAGLVVLASGVALRRRSGRALS